MTPVHTRPGSFFFCDQRSYADGAGGGFVLPRRTFLEHPHIIPKRAFKKTEPIKLLRHRHRVVHIRRGMPVVTHNYLVFFWFSIISLSTTLHAATTFAGIFNIHPPHHLYRYQMVKLFLVFRPVELPHLLGGHILKRSCRASRLRSRRVVFVE